MILKHKLPIILFILFNLVLFCSLLFLNPTYGSFDDFILSELLAGNYTGQQEFHLIFIQPIFSWMVFQFSNLIGLNNLYSLVLIEFLIINLILVITFLKKTKLIAIIYTCFILVIVGIRPTYTSISLISGLLLLFSIIIYDLKSQKIKLFFCWFLLSISILIRTEILFPLALFSFFLILSRSLLSKKNNFYNFIGISVPVFLFSINYLINHKINDSVWDKYNFWNMLRHQIHNRISQFKLNEILYPGGWSPYEHNLFVDWAYGDHKIFNLQWLKIAFDYTERFRGISSIFNLDLNYLYFNLERYNFISNWLFLFLLIIVLMILLIRKLEIKYKFLLFIFLFFPYTIFILYCGFFLLLPDRIIFPLIISLVFILFHLFEEIPRNLIHLKYLINLFFIFSIFFNFTYLFNLNQQNINEKLENKLLLENLKNFDRSGVFYMPANLNPYFSDNPYQLKYSNSSIKIFNVGCWDTFSPHWYKRKSNLNLNNQSAYDDLFLPNVYWVAKSIPNITLNLEYILKENGRKDFTVNTIKNLKNDYSIYKFK